MKNLLLTISLLLCSFSWTQKPIELKKKFLGSYSGTIASFKLDTGEDLVDVEREKIVIRIEADSVLIQIGRNRLAGSYLVLFEAKKYYVLDCLIPGRLAGERIVVYKLGKKISRDGLYPQPSAMLTKDKD
jgi:hypothetical protein